MAIYHFFRTRFPHQFCHRVTTEVEIGDYLISKVHELIKLGYLVIFFFFFFGGDYWQVNINKKCVYLISKVLELTKLEYLVKFFFLGLLTNKLKHKNKQIFYAFIYLNRSIVTYRDFNFKILFFFGIINK